MNLRRVLTDCSSSVLRHLRPHPDASRLNAWMDGELPEAEAHAAAAHVSQCRFCQQRLEQRENALELARKALEVELPGLEERFEAVRDRLFGGQQAMSPAPVSSKDLEAGLLGSAATAMPAYPPPGRLLEGLIGRRAIRVASGPMRAGGRAT